MKSHSLSPVSAPHVLLKDTAGRVKEEERKGRREGVRKFLGHGNTQGLSPLNGATGRGNVQCTDVECVQGD